jgi:hypothetical protein
MRTNFADVSPAEIRLGMALGVAPDEISRPLAIPIFPPAK